MIFIGSLPRNKDAIFKSVLATRGTAPSDWLKMLDWFDFVGWVLEDHYLMKSDTGTLYFVKNQKILESKEYILTSNMKQILSKVYQESLGIERI